MFLLSSVVFVVLLQSATGDPYCSLNDTHINCGPCTEKCVSRNQTCYRCPKQCGKSNSCKSVCEATCFNKTCEEVVDDTVPVCTKGCIDGRAGRQCQDYCPEGCKTCDQDTGKNCTSCMEGLEGQYCNITILSQSTVHSPSTSMRGCVEDCDNCKDGNVVCEDPCDCTGQTTDSTQSPLTSPASGNNVNSGVAAADEAVVVVAAAGAGVGVVAVIVVAICIATIYMYRKMQSRNNRQPLAREENEVPVDLPSSRRESDPYAYIVVVDRDCVQEHHLQAAMVIAPQLVPNV